MSQPPAVPGEHLLRTIELQPALVERLLADRHGPREVASRFPDPGRVILVGTGTSFHGAQVGEHLFRTAGFDALALPAFEYVQYHEAPAPDDVLIAISHRGVKHFTAAALQRFRERSSRWAVITGEGSPLTGEGVLTTAPQELSAVHTASHVGAMIRLAQLAVALAAVSGRSRPFWEGAMPMLPETVAAAVAARSRAEAVADAIRLAMPTHFIGAGPGWATASEGALKLREAAHVQAEGHELENFLHGPLISVEAGQTVFVVAEPGAALTRTEEITQALALIEAQVVVIGSAAAEMDGARFEVAVHRLPEVLAPIANVIPLQWVAYLCSLRRGVNADTFREDEPRYEHAIKSLKL
ncbi:MAG TPA: SIS domain-containing protein [Candidatus Limnocylindrales bacterium]|nr:SIS domain-containing protein [Candidatus Limnocylindrales bacterium]